MSGHSFPPDPGDTGPRDAVPAWPHARVSRVTPRLVIGLGIMTIGLVLALDSLGLVNGSVVFRFWPLILIAVGIVKYVSPARDGLVWIVAGMGFLMVTLGWLTFPRFWAGLLFVIGANIAWRALRPVVPTAGEEASAAIDMVAVLGGAKTLSRSTAFRGGQAVAFLGGCEIDLRYAGMPEGGEAVLDGFAFWGGIEIKVPEEWEVVNRVTAIMGGVDNKTNPLSSATRRLVVTGTAIMGGIEIKN
jgi:hypothetical protein